MLRPVFIMNEVVDKIILLASVHAGTFAGYRDFASDNLAIDIVQSPALVLLGVNLKLKSPGRAIIKGRNSGIGEQYTATWHGSIDTVTFPKVPITFQLRVVRAGRDSAAAPRPIGMKELTARFVNALIRVSAKHIPLGLQ